MESLRDLAEAVGERLAPMLKGSLTRICASIPVTSIPAPAGRSQPVIGTRPVLLAGRLLAFLDRVARHEGGRRSPAHQVICAWTISRREIRIVEVSLIRAAEE